MRLKQTPRGAIPVFTKNEVRTMNKATRIMERAAAKLDTVDTPNDDMQARASMVVNDYVEFWDAVEEAYA